jgi:uncharacterized protein YecT (DUF1311 family)
MRAALTWATVILLGSFTPALATDCSTATTQAAMNSCAADDFQSADRKFNATYKEITSRLQALEPARQLLVKSEQAWIQFRDSECMFATSSARDGSAYAMLVNQCKADLTRERTKRLEAYLRCEEGDLSCPVPAR